MKLLNILLISLFLAASAFAGDWRVFPMRTEAEYNAGSVGGEGLQLAHGFARSESNPDYIYFNHDNLTPWMSFNGGDTWRKSLCKGMYQSNAGSIIVHPTNNLRVYAIQSQLWYFKDYEYDGVYRSDDGGENWTQILAKRVGLDWNKHRYIARNICFNRNDYDTMYVAMYYREPTLTGTAAYPAFDPNDGGLYKTTDGGNSWTQLVGGPGQNSTIDKYYQIACQGDSVLLATDDGLMKYTSGSSYTALGDLPVGAVMSVFAPDSTTVWATVKSDGLYKSTNGGTNFSEIKDKTCTQAYFSFADPNTIYLNDDGVSGTIEYTTDGGSGWTTCTGISVLAANAQLSGICISADDNSDVVCFNADNGIFKSTNGTAFTKSQTLFTGYSTVFQGSSFAFDDNNVLRWGIGIADAGYQITTNGGNWFSKDTVTDDGNDITDWASTDYCDNALRQLHPTGATSLYMSVMDFSPVADTTTISASVGYVSTNEGKSRMAYYADSATHWAIDVNYVCGDDYPWIKWSQWADADTVYNSQQISHDGGVSFTDVNFAPYTAYEGIGDYAMIWSVAPSDPNIVYGFYKIFKSIIRSETKGSAGSWTLEYDGSTSFYTNIALPPIAVSPDNSDIIYVKDTTTEGITKFDTDSDTFTNLGLMSTVNPPATLQAYLANVAIDPRHGNVIYCTMGGAGIDSVWRSTDTGATWVSISENLPRISNYNLAVHPITGDVFVGSKAGTYIYPSAEDGESVLYGIATPIPEIPNEVQYFLARSK